VTTHGLEVGIVTHDGENLSRFYERGLGFALDRILDFPQGTVRRLRNGQAMLKIFQPTEAPCEADDTGWSTTCGFRYVALHVADATATVQQAIDAGASVLTPVTPHRPDAAFALLTDPDGNVLEILQEDPK
jgi:predicted enzyme related to lactoylglutathione lyase